MLQLSHPAQARIFLAPVDDHGVRADLRVLLVEHTAVWSRVLRVKKTVER